MLPFFVNLNNDNFSVICFVFLYFFFVLWGNLLLTNVVEPYSFSFSDKILSGHDIHLVVIKTELIYVIMF